MSTHYMKIGVGEVVDGGSGFLEKMGKRRREGRVGRVGGLGGGGV